MTDITIANGPVKLAASVYRLPFAGRRAHFVPAWRIAQPRHLGGNRAASVEQILRLDARLSWSRPFGPGELRACRLRRGRRSRVGGDRTAGGCRRTFARRLRRGHRGASAASAGPCRFPRRSALVSRRGERVAAVAISQALPRHQRCPGDAPTAKRAACGLSDVHCECAVTDGRNEQRPFLAAAFAEPRLGAAASRYRCWSSVIGETVGGILAAIATDRAFRRPVRIIQADPKCGAALLDGHDCPACQDQPAGRNRPLSSVRPHAPPRPCVRAALQPGSGGFCCGARRGLERHRAISRPPDKPPSIVSTDPVV